MVDTADEGGAKVPHLSWKPSPLSLPQDPDILTDSAHENN